MSNRPKGVIALTKAQVLQGRNYTEQVYIPALNGEVVIRVLTGGEMARLKAMPTRGLKLSLADLAGASGSDPNRAMEEAARIQFDMESIAIANEEQRFFSVACGLSVPGGEMWSVEEAEAIKPTEAIEQIAKEVWRISDLDERDLTVLGRFRGEPGGAADRDAAPDGVSARPDAERTDTDAGRVPADGGAERDAPHASAGIAALARSA